MTMRFTVHALAALLLVTSISAGSPPSQAQTTKKQAQKKPAAKQTAAKKPVRKRAPAHPVKKAPPQPPPPSATTPRSTAALAGDLNVFLNRTRSGSWGAMVVSLARGDTLFAHNAGERIRPASTLKLFTSALALDQLGPRHQFSTDVLYDGEIVDGTLNGNLYLRGDGDPTLSPRFIAGDPNTPPQLIAKQIAAAGITHITGDIIGDATAFEDKKIPDGWLQRYLEASYAARVSALSLDDNLVWVAITPTKSGQRALVTLEPATTAFTIKSTARTVAGSRDAIKLAKRSDGIIEVAGTIGARAGVKRFSYVVDDPAIFSAGALMSALRANNVRIDGNARLAATPESAKIVTSFASPHLTRIVSLMNRESLNLYAELLLRGAARGSTRLQGTMGTSNHTMRALLHNAGADTTAIFLADGSGLSPNSYVTTRSTVQLLAYAHTAPWGAAFHASLPVAGESALLRQRMKDGPARANLHAKTGTTAEIVALAGYVTAANGELLAFTFVYNGADRWIARESIDVMCETLAGFGR